MKIILTTCLFLLANFAFAMPNDSIGTKVVNGQRYIMHKVAKGDGVYGIGKKYGVPAADIFAANEGSEKTIKLGQVLLIPKGSAGTAKTTTGSSSSTTTKTEKVYHTVETGQTLSSIARQHSTTVTKIKELNSLKSDNITLGQKLVVGEKQTTIASTTTKKPKEVAPVEEEAVDPVEPLEDKAPIEEETKPINVVVNPPKTEDKTVGDQPGKTINTYSTDDGDEINESGLAMISEEGDLTQERSFILHPTAKIGTIVMITNPGTNIAVFARVIGNCKVEKGCVLKMSKTVAMKLGVSESTEVKVSYAK